MCTADKNKHLSVSRFPVMPLIFSNIPIYKSCLGKPQDCGNFDAYRAGTDNNMQPFGCDDVLLAFSGRHLSLFSAIKKDVFQKLQNVIRHTWCIKLSQQNSG